MFHSEASIYYQIFIQKKYYEKVKKGVYDVL